LEGAFEAPSNFSHQGCAGFVGVRIGAVVVSWVGNRLRVVDVSGAGLG
jgi:hypothetical protein